MISLAEDVCVNEPLCLCVHAFVDVWEGYMLHYILPAIPWSSYHLRLLQMLVHSFSEKLNYREQKEG